MQHGMPSKARRSRVRLVFIPLAFLLVVAAIALGLYLWLGTGDGDSARVVTGVQFPYPDGWTEEALTEADKQAGLLLKLQHDDPPASFLARTVLGALPEDFDINALADDSERALRAEIENFELDEKTVTRFGSYDAVEIRYRQIGAGADEDYEVLMVIVPTGNQTFYLTLRALEEEFGVVEAQGIDIVRTFVSYVETAIR